MLLLLLLLLELLELLLELLLLLVLVLKLLLLFFVHLSQVRKILNKCNLGGEALKMTCNRMETGELRSLCHVWMTR